MEKYLQRCLNSLLIANLDLLEVWVVNDGSKDNSLAIAREFAGKYPNAFNVIDKKNGNYGSCINAALIQCTGKYVKVLDADDWFNTDVLSLFVNDLQYIDADMVISDYVRVMETSSKKEIETFDLPPRKLLNLEDFLDERLRFIQMHAVTYKLDIFNQLEYHQTEGISYTDQQWIFMPFMRVRNFYYYPSTIYCYLIGREGQTMDTSVILKSADHLIKGIIPMMNDYKQMAHNLSEKFKEYFEDRLIMRIKYIYDLHLLSSEKVPETSLMSFDMQLKDTLPTVYEKLNTEGINKVFKYRFIKKWRETGHVNRNIIPLLECYVKVRKLLKR